MSARSELARLQRLLLLLWAIGLVAWLAWMWPRSPALALAGAISACFIHAAFLGFEFLVLPRIARSDWAPPATAAERLRAWAVETLLDIRVFAWRQPFCWRALPDMLDAPQAAPRRGVVFIHGFACNRGFWAPWMARVQREGRPCVAVNLEPVFGEIDDYAPVIDRAVQAVRQATGCPPVLIAHSMGGLAARAWWRTVDFDDSVAHVVTIGTPHAGTWIARFSRMPNGRQMQRDSAWLQDLNRELPPRAAQRFTCWWSNCDNVVMPPSTATLPGADNRFIRGAAHVELAYRPQVIDGTLALLATLDEPADVSRSAAAARA